MLQATRLVLRSALKPLTVISNPLVHSLARPHMFYFATSIKPKHVAKIVPSQEDRQLEQLLDGIEGLNEE